MLYFASTARDRRALAHRRYRRGPRICKRSSQFARRACALNGHGDCVAHRLRRCMRAYRLPASEARALSLSPSASLLLTYYTTYSNYCVPGPQRSRPSTPARILTTLQYRIAERLPYLATTLFLVLSRLGLIPPTDPSPPLPPPPAGFLLPSPPHFTCVYIARRLVRFRGSRGGRGRRRGGYVLVAPIEVADCFCLQPGNAKFLARLVR